MTDHATPDRLVIRTPDDWHLHLRDGAMLEAVLGHSARQFARAIVMPNLTPPVTTVAAARDYRSRILAALPAGLAFEPLMTAYLTDDIAPDELAAGHDQGVFVAAKLYPANATTNSAAGVTDVSRIRGALERLERIGMPLLVHGEVTDPEVDVFDREAVFIDRVLAPLLRQHPGLRVVLEHITTEQAVDFVSAADTRVAATITAHHLEINRNAMFRGGLRPHAYCLPVAKRERHRQALRRAAVSGSDRFFLGTDSAPHLRSAKERDCGCAGIFSAPVAVEAYARVFEELGALDRLEAFASEHGPRFYGLAPNTGELVLERRRWKVPETVDGPGEPLVPFHAGAMLDWRVLPRG